MNVPVLSSRRRNPNEAVMQQRWMTFVDGENLAIRAKKIFDSRLLKRPFYKEDVFIWYPGSRAYDRSLYGGNKHQLAPLPVRCYYYTSYVGDDIARQEIEDFLWEIDFEPRIFKKKRQQEKSKGVDIALATDMLSNAFRDNFDVAYLVAGDGDYTPMIEEVKRYGKIVYVSFLQSGLNPKLRIASDACFDITRQFNDALDKRE
jgi:uncharacterized LabA/DUF88 family protein